MGLYQAVAGAKITAAEWNTYYNLLKGVVGGEDTVRLAGNVAGTFSLRPNTDPASVVHLFPIKNAAGAEKFALRSDGIPVLADQITLPGSLEDGMIWRAGTRFWGRLANATVELLGALSSFYLPATAFMVYTGTPALSKEYYHVCWPLDKASVEYVVSGWRVPRTGTVEIKLVQSALVVATGNVRWAILLCLTDQLFQPLTAYYQTAAVPPAANDFSEVTMKSGLAVTAGQQMTVVAGRYATHADDTADGDVGFVGINIEYTA